MKIVVIISLIFVGLLHAIPTIGSLGVESLATLYGVTLDDQRLVLLMRHRAVLFGLLATLCFAAIVKPALRSIAIGAGLISTGSFCVLWLAMQLGGSNETDALYRVFKLDVAASLSLLLAAVLHRKIQSKQTEQQLNRTPGAGTNA